VIPEVDIPGHSSKICEAYPDVCAHWVDDSGGNQISLVDPTNEEAWVFLTTLYKELVDIFPDPEFHIGGDEVWTVPWEDSPK
jgi:hexosaminidase